MAILTHLHESTAAFVKACVALKRHAPNQWAAFVLAYGHVYQAEFDRMIANKSPDPNIALQEKSRLQFGDHVGDVFERLEEMYLPSLEAWEKKVNNGNPGT